MGGGRGFGNKKETGAKEGSRTSLQVEQSEMIPDPFDSYFLVYEELGQNQRED